MEPSAPAFDLNQLEKLRVLEDESDPDMVANLVRGFLTRTPPRIARMRELLTAGDAHTLAHEAHGLATSSGMFGMMRMRVRCKALENLARAQGTSGAGPILAELEQAFVEAQPLLKAELGIRD
jgi:HPt (histidine-containing phosphotransfer) domain-containing protein